jgi:hypothetical protein
MASLPMQCLHWQFFVKTTLKWKRHSWGRLAEPKWRQLGEANGISMPPDQICKQSWVTNLSRRIPRQLWGPGKTTYTFSVTFRFPLPPGRLACYQQVVRGWVRRHGNGKYIGVSRKRIRYFTPARNCVCSTFCACFSYSVTHFMPCRSGGTKNNDI